MRTRDRRGVDGAARPSLYWGDCFGGLDLRLTGERRLENGSVILAYAPG
jgi:hypothetical protein